MEIQLRTLLFVIASLLGSLSLPFVVDSTPTGDSLRQAAALPTPTLVPLRGLSAAAQEMALFSPSPTSTAVPHSVAVVATGGANLNLRGGPGLDAPIVGSAGTGVRRCRCCWR